jgi:hypothetical protein
LETGEQSSVKAIPALQGSGKKLGRVEIIGRENEGRRMMAGE